MMLRKLLSAKEIKVKYSKQGGYTHPAEKQPFRINGLAVIRP
jgi:hypothetical protein